MKTHSAVNQVHLLEARSKNLKVSKLNHETELLKEQELSLAIFIGPSSRT